MLHPLLAQQLKDTLNTDKDLPPELEVLLDTISHTYHTYIPDEQHKVTTLLKPTKGLPDIILFYIDQNGEIIFYNEQAKTYLSSTTQISNTNLFDYSVHKREITTIQKLTQRLNPKHSQFFFDQKIEGSEGNIYYYRWTVAGNYDGKQLQDIHVWRVDITELRLKKQWLISENRELRRLLRIMPNHIVKLTVEGNIIDHFSSDFEEAFMIENKSFGQNIESIFPEGVGQLLLRKFRQTSQTYISTRFEFRFNHSKKGKRAYEAQFLLLSERKQQFLLLIQDITLLKHQQDKIRQSEILYRNLFEGTFEGIIIRQTDGTIIDANQSAAQILGYNKKELSGKNFYGLLQISPEEQYQSSTQSEKGVLYSFVRRKDFSLRELELTEKEHMYAGKEAHLVTFRDVTERRVAAEKLRHSEERFRQLVEVNQDMIFRTNIDGYFTYVNPMVLKKTEYTEQELIPQNSLSLVVPEQRKRILRTHLKQIQENITNVYLECIVETKNKKRIWVGQNVRLLRDKEGTPFFQVIARDITQRKKIEEELVKAKQLAEKSVNTKEKFLNFISHEIRTPLHAIIALTRTLQEELGDKPFKESMQAILFSANNLLSIVNDLLDSSKMESEDIYFEYQPFNLKHIFSQIQQGFKLKARENNNELKLYFDEDIPHVLIGDATRLNQILFNLIGNALKFTQDGHVEVKVKFNKVENDTIWLEFKVLDTGIGIDNQHQDSVFQDYVQANESIARNYGGTGLGLAITKKLIEKQGGTIHLKSKLGLGSAFTVLLPFTRADEQIKVVAEERGKRTRFDELKDLKILVAEDNFINQEIIKKILSKWQVNFLVVNDGKKVIDILKKEDYHLLLLDLHMPELDGFQTARLIRSGAVRNKKLPIIAVSASGEKSVEEELKQYGINHYVLKPFYPEHLYNTILEVMPHLVQKNSFEELEMYNYEKVNDSEQYFKAYSYLREITDGDEALIEELFDIFIKQSEILIKALQKAITTENPEKIQELAHKAKPVFETVGIEKGAEILKLLEEGATELNPVDTLSKLREDAISAYEKNKFSQFENKN